MFGITGQLLESIAESELQESVNLNATDKFGDRQLVQSPSNKTSSTDAIPQDTKNNFMGNIIKKNRLCIPIILSQWSVYRHHWDKE